MAHIPDQLIKINSNIQEAETILSDLKKRTKTENVGEQIEHFESMLNKLNNLKESYLQLSAQFETTCDMKNSLLCVTSVLQNNNQGVSNYDSVNGISSCAAGSVFNIRNAFSSDDQLEQLKQERDRLKKELHDHHYDSRQTDTINVDVTNPLRSFNSPNSFTDLVSDLHNFVGLDLSFYISILDHHIDIGSKMIDMVDGLSLSDNLEKGISLLKEVIQRLNELRERFQSVQSTKENIQNQSGVDESILQHEMETFNNIFEDLKVNFATGVKCFKSAMDIIQSYLDPGSIQVADGRTCSSEGISAFSSKLNDTVANGTSGLHGDEITSIHSKNNNNNSESASEDNNNRSNEEEEEDDNNDAGDEDSDDSCREKDQDESMEIGVGPSGGDSMNEHIDQEAMHNLRLQTEFEQKEILRLLEEKRIMQKKLADLKRAKEVAKNQALSLAHTGNVFGDFSHFLRSTQCNDLDDNDEEVLSNTHRPDSLALRTGDMVSEMGSLLKMLSDMKSEVPCDESYQSSPSRKPNSSTSKPLKDQSSTSTRVPFNCNSYSPSSNVILPELNEKAEELKQKQSQIKKLQEMLDQIKNDSLTLNESIIHDSNDDYHSDHNNEREISNNGRPGKGRDSVTFQEPVATFIANEELYENMREVRMRREELRDRSARNSNGDPRSPSGRALDSGNAPGAPPDAPTRMPVTSHETASQDRTTAATWGSSSAGGDDYEDHSGSGINQLNRENLRIRSEGTRVSPLSITTTTTATDERSRVAPVGQSSTFRSKVRDSSSYIKNVIDNDFNNLKSQIENIASLCRNMAVEQNRLSRDIADLKCGSSPRMANNGPDLVINSGSSLGGPVVAKQHGLLTDDNLQHWVASNNPCNNSVTRNGVTMATTTAADSGNRAAANGHPDNSWEETSIASSTALLHHHSLQHLNLQTQRPTPAWYYPPLPGYHNVMHQQNMLLQNHAMFMKLQMSLIASQLEQQRLCHLALQQQQYYGQSSHPGWPTRGMTPPYYPPPGPLGMLPLSANDPSLMGTLPPTFADLDGGLYAMYPSDNRSDAPSTTANQHAASNSNNPWKHSFPPSRNNHRN